MEDAYNYSSLRSVLVKRILSCELCSHVMGAHPSCYAPKFLDCSHTFCAKCVSKYMEQMGIFSSIICPVCNEETVVGVNGIDGLHDNQTIIRLFDILNDYDMKSSDISITRDSTTNSSPRTTDISDSISRAGSGAYDDYISFHQERFSMDKKSIPRPISKSRSISHPSTPTYIHNINETNNSNNNNDGHDNRNINNNNINNNNNNGNQKATSLLTGQEICVVLECPTTKLGKLIGLRGGTIKSIRQRTECIIEIRKASKTNINSTNRIFLKGTPEQITEAQSLINEILKPITLSDSIHCDLISPFESYDSKDSGGGFLSPTTISSMSPSTDQQERLLNNVFENDHMDLLHKPQHYLLPQRLTQLQGQTSSIPTLGVTDLLAPWCSHDPPSSNTPMKNNQNTYHKFEPFNANNNNHKNIHNLDNNNNNNIRDLNYNSESNDIFSLSSSSSVEISKADVAHQSNHSTYSSSYFSYDNHDLDPPGTYVDKSPTPLDTKNQLNALYASPKDLHLKLKMSPFPSDVETTHQANLLGNHNNSKKMAMDSMLGGNGLDRPISGSILEIGGNSNGAMTSSISSYAMSSNLRSRPTVGSNSSNNSSIKLLTNGDNNYIFNNSLMNAKSMSTTRLTTPSSFCRRLEVNSILSN